MKRSLGHADTAAECLLLRLHGLRDHLAKAGDVATLEGFVPILTTATDLREWLRLAEEVAP